ncbi:hypothetical protein COV81_05325 [Candidatus Peregrinibacteria bacterium CG11_big_fil_rev_8_21_14_0_20_41_10]|nr:MAG: hypothetical protein COV81_05325 [Candidatus Peregrinibacteria bacterium CG11_big_fil_rev_8_21_14_0_20_41_10]
MATPPNIQRLFIYLAVGLLLILPANVTAKSFGDVAPALPQAMAIDALSNDGTISGYPDGSFKPAQTIIRAEALKVILLAFNVNQDGAANINFKDVVTTDWYHPFVKAAVSLKIVEGYGDQTFRPANVVNLAESLKMALAAAAINVGDAVDSNHTDLPAGAWYKKYFDYALEHNLIDTDAQGRINPAKEMSRADFVELIYRAKVSDSTKKFDITYNWKNISASNGIKALYPFNWENYETPAGLVFYHRDAVYSQAFVAHTYPSSAHIVTELLQADPSKNATQVLDTLQQEYVQLYGINEVISERGEKDGRQTLSIHVPNQRTLDYFIYLKEGLVLTSQASYGNGPKRSDFIKTIYYFQNNLDFKEPTEVVQVLQDKDALLNQAKANILIEGKGQTTIDLLHDAAVFETDNIGVGTGAIDYYYSASMDVSLKYERSSDTILDIETGKTSAF